jgi:AcrR family transcriptional regulator
MRKSRAEAKAETRARLLAAARRAFVADGFRAASLTDIADEAGYSVGALYSNFESKDDLFVSVFEEYVAQRAGELDAIAAGDSRGARRAARVAEQWMGKLAEEPQWFAVLAEFAGYAARDPELRARFAVSFGALRVTGARLITEGGFDGQMEATELATLAKALGNGLALERMIDPAAVPDDLYARALTGLLRWTGEPKRAGRR